jgi:hypothetical protein
VWETFVNRLLDQASSVALTGAIFASLGGAEAGAVLSQMGALACGSVQETFIQAFHFALLTCMIIAAMGVFTSLSRGHAR